MNSFENHKNVINSEEIKRVDQLASKEEAITFSEKRELLKNSISELKLRQNQLLSELENIIEDLEDGLADDVRGQEYAREKNESLNQIDKYLKEEREKLIDMEEYSAKIKNSILSSKN